MSSSTAPSWAQEPARAAWGTEGPPWVPGGPVRTAVSRRVPASSDLGRRVRAAGRRWRLQQQQGRAGSSRVLQCAAAACRLRLSRAETGGHFQRPRRCQLLRSSQGPASCKVATAMAARPLGSPRSSEAAAKPPGQVCFLPGGPPWLGATVGAPRGRGGGRDLPGLLCPPGQRTKGGGARQEHWTRSLAVPPEAAVSESPPLGPQAWLTGACAHACARACAEDRACDEWDSGPEYF